MRASLVVAASAIVVLGLCWLILWHDSPAPQEPRVESLDTSSTVVAAVEQASAEIGKILMSEKSLPKAPESEMGAAPTSSASPQAKSESAKAPGQMVLTDYDFVAIVANTPRFVEADQMHYSRQLNPRGLAAPAWVVKAVGDDVAEAKKKALDLTNQLGAVRGVEMSELRKAGALKRLDRSVAPQIYDDELLHSRRFYCRDNPEAVKVAGWEGAPEFQLFFNNRLTNALAAKTKYTQSLFSSDGFVYVAGVADLPKFHQLLKDGAVQIVATDLCVRVLDHYRVAGMLNEQERDELWARFSTLLGNMMEKLSR